MAGQRPMGAANAPSSPRPKGGGRFVLNLAAIERAEAALRGMAGEFDQWIRTEVANMEAARDVIRAEGLTGEARANLYRRAHDLKGMGGTYGYPIVSRLAGLLARLLETGATSDAVKQLADAHVNAIRAAVSEEIKDGSHPVGQALVLELERQVDEIAGA